MVIISDESSSLAHGFDTNTLLVGEKHKNMLLYIDTQIGEEVELIPTATRSYSKVLQSASHFEHNKNRVNVLDTPSTVRIVGLESGQIHMNLIVRYLIALLCCSHCFRSLR